jgi:amino acid adenylation domain-containing protein
MKPETPEDLYKLSPTQAGILFHSLLTDGDDVYSQLTTSVLRGKIDPVAFEQAWQRVVDRNSILRTSFLWEGLEKPLQVVHRQARLPLDYRDWRGLSEAGQRRELETFLAKHRKLGFDLAVAPLMRVALLRLSDQTYQLVWGYHHLILDGWSIPLLTQEVLDIYRALSRGAEPLLASSSPFRLYIEWLQRQDLGRAEAFWRRTLAGIDSPSVLESDGESPVKDAGRGAEPAGFGHRKTFLAPAAAAALQELGRRNGLTLNTLVQGAWALLLGRYTGQRDVLFGTVFSGRPADLVGAERMIGVLINTLPIRARLGPEDEPLLSWLTGFQQHLFDVNQYDYSPLVDVQGWSEVPRGRPLFESLVVLENYPLGESPAGEDGGDALEVGNAEFGTTTNYPLTLLVGVAGTMTSLDLIYDRSRFGEALMARLLGHFARLLAILPVDPSCRLIDLEVLTPAERHQVLIEWNDTRRPESTAGSLAEFFVRQAELTPNAVAVVAGATRVSYGELRSRADRLSRHLRSLGVRPEVCVGLCAERSVEMLVGMLGILVAGGAYLPLDPAYPKERLAFMLADTGVPVLVTQERLRGSLPTQGVKVVCLDGEEWSAEADGGMGGGDKAGAGHLSSVIYTSGSTGTPKGVGLEHRSALALLNWAAESFGDTEVAGVLATTSICFDLSVYEIFVPLTRGGTVILVRDALAAAQAPPGEATLLNTVPSVLSELLRTDSFPASVRTVNLAGEPLTRDLVSRIYARGSVDRVLNLYGPSEDTTYSTVASVPAAGDRVFIGRPISNTRAYLLDPACLPAPLGAAGELHLGGAGLARGYLGRPDLTAEKFIPDPFGTEPGGRLYRTGDRARFAADGQLEFLGRFDHQVKIRGFRIELGEIDAALRAHPAVADAVAAVSRGGAGDPRIVAYLVLNGGLLPTVSEMRSFLRQRLPDFMLPSVLVELQSLPLTPSGKVDRRALPAPSAAGSPEPGARRPPRNPTEEVIAGIWSVVIGVEQIGIDDDFFELGGHSLMATQVVSRLRQILAVDLSLASLFGAPTVARLAERVDEEMRSGAGMRISPLVRIPRGGGLPLSFSQERLWMMDQLDPDLSNLPLAVRILGPLVPPVLARALDQVVARHEALRTRFVLEGEELAQVVDLPQEVSVPLLDLSLLAPEARSREAQRIVHEEGWRRFDLERGPLLRARLLRLAAAEHVVLLATHHIASDAWSLGILIREVTAVYAALSRGDLPSLPELPIQYADFAVWQRQWLNGEVLQRQLDFWRQQLAESAPVLDLPIDLGILTSEERREGRRVLELPRPLTSALRQLGHREGATLFMTLLAVFQVLLARYSGQERFNIGSTIAGRGRLETEGLIGFFVNTLIFPADVTGDPSFRKLLRRVRHTALDAYAQQDLPYERLLETLQPPRRPGINPLFQILLTLHNVPPVPSELSLSELRVYPFELESERLRSGLFFDIQLAESQEGLAGVLRYRRGLFQEAWVDRLLEQLLHLALQIVERPDAPLSTLELMGVEVAVAVHFNDDLES